MHEHFLHNTFLIILYACAKCMSYLTASTHEELLRSGAMDRVVQLLLQGADLNVQFGALWALTNLWKATKERTLFFCLFCVILLDIV